MNLEIGFYVLVGLNIVQFFFWGVQVQRLVDKLMSRNYYDYEVSKGLNHQTPIPKIQEETGVMEDMRTLNEINPY
jgi:hypothetical protein